ncbi:glycosyltransferase family 4 protein [Methyloceanibacter sp.]|uniref:glycosyltransferase family 4 protein n=1 Tax=Methyloceanibacter sp. TaxID=1965321 RepID=UPI003D6CB3C5
MLYIDVGNTLRSGLRTGIQRVVRSLSYELAAASPAETRLIAFDVSANRYFALADPTLVRSADSLADIGREARVCFDLDTLVQGDIFFEPDASWTEPVNRGALFRLLKSRGVILVVLNHDIIPFLLPQFFPGNTLSSFSEAIADHIQYADYVLATSARVARDLGALSQRFLGRSITTRVIKLGADFAAPVSAGEGDPFATTFPELDGLRFLLAVGTIEPRKNHALLLQAFDRLDAKDAALVVVGRKGWMADEVLALLTSHPAFGKRVFWHPVLGDSGLLALYRHAYASVQASQYEGYGLPVVEALSQGCVTIASDTGSLPEVTAGHAVFFRSGDGEALHAILDRLYGDPDYYAGLKASARSFRPTPWREAGRSVAAALADIASGASHDFGAPLRQMVFLSVHPERLDLALQAARANLGFIDRIAVLTKPSAHEAITAVAARHFSQAHILTDDVVAGGELPADHQARNTWLRKRLYRQDAIETNFLAADEDSLALRPLARGYYQEGSLHTAYSFQDDMATWLAGSPTTTSFDRGMRNAWKLLAEAAYPARAYASHMPQIVNKSLANEIFDRFVIGPDGTAYDEWSLYFNVAQQLYPRHFATKPYGTLGWPMCPGDWLPEIEPVQPAFENYYPQNYEPAERGMFAGLKPLGDLEAKTSRSRAALMEAHRAELKGGGVHSPGLLALIVTPEALKFVGTGTILAGKRNVRRVLLVNGSSGVTPVTGRLDMFVTEPRGGPVWGESVRLGEICWIPLLPPEKPGLYAIRFFAALDSGARLEARGLLTVVAGEERQ